MRLVAMKSRNFSCAMILTLSLAAVNAVYADSATWNLHSISNDWDTAEGDDALLSVTTAADDTAMGLDPMYRNTTGSDNALASWIWRGTRRLHKAHYAHTATLLQNGQVLVAGGIDSTGHISASAELYDPASETWSAAGRLNTARFTHTATLLQNGMVLVAGGQESSSNGSASAELYDPASRIWTCHRQPQHSTLFTHGDVATKRHGPCCRGIHEQFHCFRERRTVRPGQWDLDCYRRSEHRTH